MSSRPPIGSAHGVNSLTTGFLETFVHGPENQPPTTPVLQVLNWKRTTEGDSENTHYRLVLSDGKHSYRTCMVASKMGPRTDGSDLDMAVLKLKHYVTNHVGLEPHRTRVLVVTDFDVLFKPGEMLGQPRLLSSVKSEQPLPTSTITEHQATTSKLNLTPTHTSPAQQVTPKAQQQHRPPPLPSIFAEASPSKASADQPVPVQSINSLSPNPYQNKWRIRARVTNKSDIKHWSKGKLFSMDLADKSGEIRATVWNDQVNTFYGQIQQGQVYIISGGNIKPAKKQFTSIDNDFEISFAYYTEVTPCQDPQEDFPEFEIQYNFVKLNELVNCAIGSQIDVIGVLKSVGDLKQIVTKSGETVDKRELVLVDDTNTDVRLTLWREKARDFDLTNDHHPVVSVKGASVGEYLNIKESNDLEEWWVTTVVSQQQTAVTEQGFTQVKPIMVADAQGLGKNGLIPDYFSIIAQIVLAKHDICLYQSCINEGCKKKLVDLGNGSYRCEKCNKEMDAFKYNAVLSAEVADFTGTCWVTLFSDQVEQLTGITPDDLGRLRDTKPQEFEQIFRNVLSKPMMFRIRAKAELFKDEPRVKWIVQNVRPLDLASYETYLNEQSALLDQLNPYP